MGKQLNIFEQHEIRSSKQRYNNFYAGVRERYEEERRAKQKRKGMIISIKYGLIPIEQMLNITPKN